MFWRDRYLRWVFKPVRKKAVPADLAEALVAGNTLKMVVAAAIGMPCFLAGVTAVILVVNGMETSTLGRFLIVVFNAAWILSLWFVGCARAALVHLTIHIERHGMAARMKGEAPAWVNALSEGLQKFHGKARVNAINTRLHVSK